MKPLRWTLWVIALLLLVVHAVILLAHSGLLLVQGVHPSFGVLLYWLLVLGTGGALVVGMIKGTLRKTNGFTFFCAVSLAWTASGLVWFVMDDPPIENDFTEGDVVPEPNGSHEYLEFFNKADAAAIRKANQSLDQDHGGKLSTAAFDEVWAEIAPYREVIDALDGFDVLCDLPPGSALNIETPLLNFIAIRDVSMIYGRYFLLKTSLGRGREGVEDFCRLHRVARKGMRGASVLLSKMIFTAIATGAMDKAYAAVLVEACDEETLRRLKENFTSLDPEEISMERPLMAEYVVLKNTIKKDLRPGNFLSSSLMASGTFQEEEPPFAPASYFVYYLGFKPNKSLRVMKHYHVLLLEAVKHHPVDTTESTAYLNACNRTPPIKNMVGWLLNSLAMPNFGNYCRRTEEARIKSDLLAVAIHKRLGETLEIEDFFFGGPCRYREEQESMRHPGRDGEFDTEDDIILGEKPAKTKD